MIKPNAFVFKVLIDGQYRTCVCPRINDKWSETDISYINEDSYTAFDDVLDNELFSIVFVGYVPNETGEGFTLKHVNSCYFKSDTINAEELYNSGEFFNTVEKIYKSTYEFE